MSRAGIEATWFSRVWMGRSFQARRIAILRLSTDEYVLFSSYNLLTRCPQMFSIGLRSGEHAGQSRTSIEWALKKSFVDLLACTEALSCWKIQFWSAFSWRNGSKWFCSTCWYSWESTLADVNSIATFPPSWNAAYTITVPPPKFLLGKNNFSLRKSCQWYRLPSSPSRLKRFSSEKITRMTKNRNS